MVVVVVMAVGDMGTMITMEGTGEVDLMGLDTGQIAGVIRDSLSLGVGETDIAPSVNLSNTWRGTFGRAERMRHATGHFTHRPWKLSSVFGIANVANANCKS